MLHLQKKSLMENCIFYAVNLLKDVMAKTQWAVVANSVFINVQSCLYTPTLSSTYTLRGSYIHQKAVHFTAWKVSKYGVFSGPYFPAFGLNTDQKKLRIWTLFTQCFFSWSNVTHALVLRLLKVLKIPALVVA